MRYTVIILLIIIFGSTASTLAQMNTSSNVVQLNEITFSSDAYFNSSKHRINKYIHVFQDDDYKIADILSGQYESLFVNNSKEVIIRKDQSYWTRVVLESKENQDSLLIEFGDEWLNTWGNVEYYIYHADSLIGKGVSGTSIKPADRTIREALNLAWLPISSGKTVIYCKLQNHKLISDDPNYKARYTNLQRRLSYSLYDPDRYHTIDGYKFSGEFKQSAGLFLSKGNYFKQCLEIVEDQQFDLAGVKTVWDSLAHYHYWDLPEENKVYWLRMKVIGNEFHQASHLFGLCYGTYWNFERTDAYVMQGDTMISHQVTGNKVNRSDRSIPSKWNLFRAEVQPKDTVEVFLRLEGAGKRFTPVFNMIHLDEDSFWPTISFVNSIYVAFFGILIVQFFYFLIVGIIEKEPIHLWLVMMICGFALSLGFVGGDLNYFLLPCIQDWHPWITCLGSILMVLGLFSYIRTYLTLDELLPFNVSHLFRPILAIHALISLQFAWRLHCIGAEVAIYETYYQLMFGSLILIFTLALFIGVYALLKGNRHARYFVFAFGFLLLVFITRMVMANAAVTGEGAAQLEWITAGTYMHYVLLMSVVLTMILLSFGNADRVRNVKEERTKALIRVEEGQKRNSLLSEKNEIINKRIKENEYLITEIHHRVKNNLQILSSLLSLQSDYIQDASALEAIQKGKSRVEAIGLLHQMLYIKDANITSINMEDYFEELCLYIEDNFSGPEQNIKISRHIDISHLDVDTAIPLGLTVTELITNSIKHGFKNEKEGRIEVHLWIDANQELCLKVADNGVGVPVEKEAEVKYSFGTELIDLLTEKLEGTIFKETKEGYSITIKYKHFVHIPAHDQK